LCAVQDAANLDDFSANPVNDQVWKAGAEKFARRRFAARTAKKREAGERIHFPISRKRDTARRSGAVVLIDVIADLCKVTNGGRCPSDLHQP
jgi:hypothetical protein